MYIKGIHKQKNFKSINFFYIKTTLLINYILTNLCINKRNISYFIIEQPNNILDEKLYINIFINIYYLILKIV